MRVGTAVKATALLATAIMLALFTTQGSYALWNRMIAAGMGSVRAADFKVVLSGSNNTGTYDMVLADGSPATVSLDSIAAPLGELAPGVSVYAGVDISNMTNAGSPLSVLTTLPHAPELTDMGPGSGLANHLIIRPAPAAHTGECRYIADAVYLETFIGLQIPQGGSAAICFQLQLAPGAPSTLQGQSVSITVPLHVEQVR